ncbi:glycosyltransferase family 2 protein [Empedobacter brevis]
MNPLISIIIPTYKNKGGLDKAIQSVINQTYKNVEILVIDDNNKDDIHRIATESLMSKYERYSNIYYIKHKVNKNGAAARNTGLQYSKGEYIAFLDDDDEFFFNKLEKQLNYITNSNFDCVYCNNLNYGKLSNIPFPREGDLSKELLLMDSKLLTPTLFFTKSSLEIIKGFDEQFNRHQDYEIMLRFFQKGFKVGYVEDTYSIIGNQGQNRIFGKKMYEIKKMFLSQFSDIIERIEQNDPGFKNKLYTKHYFSLFIALLKGKEFVLANKIFMKYLVKRPLLFMRYLIRYTNSYIKIKRK